MEDMLFPDLDPPFSGSALNASLPFSGSALNASPPSTYANASTQLNTKCGFEDFHLSVIVASLAWFNSVMKMASSAHRQLQLATIDGSEQPMESLSLIDHSVMPDIVASRQQNTEQSETTSGWEEETGVEIPASKSTVLRGHESEVFICA
ncbi:hypothetical protein DAPPUDRAFT_245958 [Daphnia pulex]|uniref:Uncharacterized protein n=1 Tax=Daphnia pulex TaxID=6669 RepID=E9GPD2_DAPPU|nr:hypothetical protein DAPPUDRAFT_245958 [Daphnia pulex]|eukprot:EFX78700.1 hypothetical protein DAPPUDRAFT_245958 [Daphnia pulex]